MRTGFSSRARLRRAVAALLLVAFLPISSVGCFGKFQLLRNVYTFNTEVTPDPWMRWFIFLVIFIVPIYGLAGVIDLLLANSIEFWTGENPVRPTPGTRRHAVAPDGSAVTVTFQREGKLEFTITRTDGSVTRFQLAREGSSLAARDAAGMLLARVADVGGQPTIVEAGALP